MHWNIKLSLILKNTTLCFTKKKFKCFCWFVSLILCMCTSASLSRSTQMSCFTIFKNWQCHTCWTHKNSSSPQIWNIRIYWHSQEWISMRFRAHLIFIIFLNHSRPTEGSLDKKIKYKYYIQPYLHYCTTVWVQSLRISGVVSIKKKKKNVMSH